MLVDRPSKGLLVRPSLGLGVIDRRPDIRVGLVNRDPGDRYTPGEYKRMIVDHTRVTYLGGDA